MNVYYMNIEELPKEMEEILILLKQKVPASYEAVQKKLAEQKNTKDQCRSLAAYLLLAYAYDLYVGEVHAGTMPRVMKTVSGKPFFEGEGELYFNLSHSGYYVVCALSDVECGVDIQEIRTVKEHFAERFFSEKEQERMQREILVGRSRDFTGTEIWCKKESLGKCRGCGLKEGTVSLDTETCAEYIRVLRILEDAGYAFSCCTDTEVEIEVLEVKYAELGVWLRQN